MAYTTIPASSSGGTTTFPLLSSGIMYVTTGTGAVTSVALTGLTATSSTLKNDLITGLAGGQTVIGDTASGGNLTLSSTSHATKGKTVFGSTAGMYYDEAAGQLILGATSAVSTSIGYQATRSVAGQFIALYANNTNAGTTASVNFQQSNGTATLVDQLCGASFTTAGNFTAGTKYWRLVGGSGNMVHRIEQAAGAHIWETGSSPTEKMKLSTEGYLTMPSGFRLGLGGATAAVQQTSGANLTNNVTSGGTDDTVANYTDLTIYANDSAAIRNDIYQLARKVKQLNDGLRTYGLFT